VAAGFAVEAGFVVAAGFAVAAGEGFAVAAGFAVGAGFAVIQKALMPLRFFANWQLDQFWKLTCEPPLVKFLFLSAPFLYFWKFVQTYLLYYVYIK
jgi:hypothetical protein